MALDDAYAIDIMGCFYYHGQHGLSQDHAKALELWHQAAALGHMPHHIIIILSAMLTKLVKGSKGMQKRQSITLSLQQWAGLQMQG